MNKRLVCLCNDCQAYAHYLGRVEKILDVNGGTEIIPVHPAKLQITHGKEKLSCVRLSDDGVNRWFAACCKSPVANTPRENLPYVGLFSRVLDLEDGKSSIEKTIGPVFARINGKYGIPPLPAGTSKNTPLRVMLYVIKFMLAGRMKGLGVPSPLNGLEPKVLSDPEYYALIEKTGRPF
jgi:hypothetical protein